MAIFTFSFLLLLKHIFADYVMQRINSYQKRHVYHKHAIREIYKHVLDHTITMSVLMLVYVSTLNGATCAVNCNLLYVFIILFDSGTHFIIDYIKSQVFTNFSQKYKYTSIAIDQIIIVYMLYK